MKKKIVLVCITLLVAIYAFTQTNSVFLDCSAKLENNVLTLENSRISRTYQLNEGNIITSSLADKVNGKVWQMTGKKTDLALPGET